MIGWFVMLSSLAVVALTWFHPFSPRVTAHLLAGVVAVDLFILGRLSHDWCPRRDSSSCSPMKRDR
jgi:hypothetical protein